jgi:hypothetical protein
MSSSQNLLGFAKVCSDDPLVCLLDDSVCHQDCMSRWQHRDDFVRAWNRQAIYGLGPYWFLEVTRSGEVRYLSWIGRLLYRLGWKRSPLLPPLIRRDCPLLKLQLINGGYSPLWVSRGYSCFGQSNPEPEAIGLSPASAGAVRAWANRFRDLCAGHTSGRLGCEDSATLAEWEALGAEGLRLWEVLKQEVGHRYRVVYLDAGRIFEPGNVYF